MTAVDVIADWLHGCYCPYELTDGHDIEAGYVAGAQDILDSLSAHGWRVVKLAPPRALAAIDWGPDTLYRVTEEAGP